MPQLNYAPQQSFQKLNLKSDKINEYEILRAITQKLKAASTEEIGAFGKLASAVHNNNKIWSFFLTSVADPNNHLPIELKKSIAELAQFSLIHGEKILKSEGDVTILIEINLSIMNGLKK